MRARSHTLFYTLRALLAFGFFISFYGVAVILALCLLVLPILGIVMGGRRGIFLAIGCVVAAGVILWSLVPTRETFEPPGSLIFATEHPRLFALIQEVATAMSIAMPSEVYLVPEVNAFISQSGGFLGVGGRRVMGIGVPLLASLNVSQLKALIAHEFGHFAGGVTCLSRPMSATRSAMIRKVSRLAGGGSRVLPEPFETMLKGYMAFTHAIVREQELLADRWAVKLAGLEALRTALCQVELHANTYDLFLRQEVEPLTSLKVIPKNVFEGYRKFMGSNSFVTATQVARPRSQEGKAPLYDPHPAIEARVRLAESLGFPSVPMDTTPASELMSQSARVEEAFSERILENALDRISWDQVPGAWRRLWKRSATRLQVRLPEMNVGAISHYLTNTSARDTLAEAVEPALVGDRSPERAAKVRATVARAVYAYVSSLLSAQGWTGHATPGEPIKLRKDGEELEVMEAITQAMDGHSSPDILMNVLRTSGLKDSAVWTFSEDARREALLSHCPVKLEETKKYATVTGPIRAMLYPKCCAVCCGPLDLRQRTSFSIGGFGKRSGVIWMAVPLCLAHKKQGRKAWDVRDLDPRGGMLTLRVPNIAYARLFPRVNA